MQQTRMFYRILLIIFSVGLGGNGSIMAMAAIKEAMTFSWGALHGRALIKYRPESFYARNMNLLNNNVSSDRQFFNRHTLDINIGLDVKIGDKNAAEFFMTYRNKANWGNAETVAVTTEAATTILESVQAPHRHFLTKNVIWIRELWLKFSINEALNISFAPEQYFMLGYFPFELGRGIALGSAYAVNPGLLGFYSNNTIDQFAPGFLFTGGVWDSLKYDVYGAVLDNRSDSFGATALKIRGQEYGHRYKQDRGFGHVDYLLAARLRWMPYKSENELVSFEPYALYDHVPEQRIEFPADAKSDLGTFGLAGEFKYYNIEFGFDTAFNVGGQHVKGWDRNRIDQENRAGVFTLINTQVLDQNGVKAIYDPNSAAGKEVKKIIENSAQDQSQNGKFIGQVGDLELFNSDHRFTNPYNNKFEGWMAIADAAYWFCDRSMRVATMAGVASGDQDPNRDINDPLDSNVDGNYKGFIPLQEIYSGNRVKSALLLGNPGKIPRPLTTPRPGLFDIVPSSDAGFTNLVFTGGSYLWTPKWVCKRFNVQPNIIAYWQQRATNKFDIKTKMSLPELASRYLGLEINTFFDIELLKDFKLYAVGGAFIPGSHYKDIKGKPLNKDQQRILDRLDVTGVDTDNVPLLGTDTAYTINIGLEYRF